MGGRDEMTPRKIVNLRVALVLSLADHTVGRLGLCGYVPHADELRLREQSMYGERGKGRVTND